MFVVSVAASCHCRHVQDCRDRPADPHQRLSRVRTLANISFLTHKRQNPKNKIKTVGLAVQLKSPGMRCGEKEIQTPCHRLVSHATRCTCGCVCMLAFDLNCSSQALVSNSKTRFHLLASSCLEAFERAAASFAHSEL